MLLEENELPGLDQNMFAVEVSVQVWPITLVTAPYFEAANSVVISTILPI